jgi:hypothetical protein
VAERANRNEERNRRLQAETERTEQIVMRYEIFEADVRLRRTSQPIYSYVMRIRNGRIEFLPDNTKPDTTIYTDFPTVYAISQGEITLTFPDRPSKVIRPFGAMDAYRIGRIECVGTSWILRNMLLFEETVLPQISGELRIGSPH